MVNETRPSQVPQVLCPSCEKRERTHVSEGAPSKMHDDQSKLAQEQLTELTKIPPAACCEWAQKAAQR